MMTRKQFLGSMVGLVGGLVGMGALSGCSTPDLNDEGYPGPGGKADGTGPDAGLSTCGTTTSVEIDSNHGHAMTVSAADVAAGVDKTYNIQGASGHSHTVTITAAMFATLQATGTVMASSSENKFHTHDITVTCSPDGPPPATCTTASVEIDSNHGHAMTVAAADVAAGVDKTYNIKGASGHNHTVTITAAMFATLASTGTVMASSSESSFHTHDITVTC